MKKYLLLFVISFCFSTLLFSQDEFGMLPGPNFDETKVLVYNKSDILFAGTWGAGVKKSVNDATSWIDVNSGLTNMYITDLKVGPTNDLYASTFGGGVFKSTNSGASWQEINIGLTNNIVRCLYTHTKDTIICGTYGDGVFISTNGGNTWTQRVTGLNYRDVNCLIVNFNNVLFAGTYGNGIYTSTNFGVSWVKNNGGIATQYINGFLIAKGVIVSCYTNGRAIYESDNDGKSWSELVLPEDNTMIDNNFSCVIVNKNSNNKDLVVGTRSQGLWVYKRVAYDNYVRNWQTRGGITSIAQKTNGVMVAYSCKDGYLRSADGFWTNENLSTMPFISIPTNRIFPFKNNLVYAGNDKGGLYSSTNNGTTFVSVPGFETKIIFDAFVGKKRYIGTNNGLYISSDGTNWNLFLAGDSITSVYEGGTNGSRIFVVKATYKTIQGDLGPVSIGITKTIKSDNQGSSWDTLDTEFSLGSYIMKSVNKNGVAFGGYSNSATTGINILRSTDNIANFFTKFLMADYQAISSNCFSLDRSNGYIVGNGIGLQFYDNTPLFIRNDVLHFVFPNTTKNCSISQAEVFNDDTLYVGTINSTGLYRSQNHGQSWDSLNRAFNVGNINHLQISSEKDVFFTTGSLYRNVYPGSMGIPKLKVPLYQATKVSYRNASFQWDSSKKAELYQIHISRDTDFVYRDLEVTLAPNSHTINNDLLPATKYFWKARGKNYGSFSEWSNVFSFTTSALPVKLQTPKRYAVGIKTSSVFSWNKTTIPSNTYTIQIAEDSLFNKTYLTYTSSDTTLPIKNLKPLTYYWWRVKSEITEDWSEIWKFKTTLPAPQLVFPAHLSEKNDVDINFSWKNVNLANEYLINLAEDSLFEKSVYNGNSSGLNSQLIQNLNYNKWYYWRVSAKDNEGTSEWSQEWAFKTGIPAPKKVSPDSNAKNIPVKVLIRWASVKFADLYDLQISDKKDFSSVFKQVSDLTETQYEVSGLQKFTSYYWRVKAKLPDKSESDYSIAWNFKTIMDITILSEPLNNSKDIGLNIFLKWEAINGATQYRVQLSKNDSYTDLVFNDSTISENKKDAYLAFNTQYWWRVRAYGDSSLGEWSNQWTFKTMRDPSSVIDLGKLSINIYPNPFNEEVTLKFNGELAEIREMSITNETGSEIMKLDISKLNGNNIILETKNFSQGTYFLKVVTNEGAKIEKLNCVKK